MGSVKIPRHLVYATISANFIFGSGAKSDLKQYCTSLGVSEITLFHGNLTHWLEYPPYKRVVGGSIPSVSTSISGAVIPRLANNKELR